MLTIGSVTTWLQQKLGGADDLNIGSDAPSFLEFLQKKGITNIEKVDDELYYDWIDSRI